MNLDKEYIVDAITDGTAVSSRTVRRRSGVVLASVADDVLPECPFLVFWEDGIEERCSRSEIEPL